MFRKSFISLVFVAALIVAAQISILGQNAPVNGTVELEKPDGTREPVANALIEVFRTDIKTGFPSAKTGKKGEFAYAGLPLGGKFAFSVSAPGCAPTILPEVKAGQEKLLITMKPGDGSKFSEAEVRAGASAKPGTGEPTAEQKKAKADYDKQVGEHNEKKKKAEDSNKIINEANKVGAAAFEARNFDLAIAKFEEGYNADPEFEGSAPIMLRNKGVALRERGIYKFNQSAKADEAARAAALENTKADFSLAGLAFDKALDIIAKAPAGDAAAQANLTRSKLDTLRDYVILHSVIAKMRLDPAKTAEAIPLLDSYLALETDEVRKLKELQNWASYMRESGEMKNAIHGYRIIMEKQPDNLDAIAGLGLSLFNDGVSSVPENKEKMQEGLNLMQKFADTAPDTHVLKSSVKDAVDYLKNTAKLAPQKVATPKKRP